MARSKAKPEEPVKSDVNLDEEIVAVQIEIAYWRGKLDALQALKKTSAIIILPKLEPAPAPIPEETGSSA